MADFHSRDRDGSKMTLAYAARGTVMFDRVRTADATGEFDRRVKNRPDKILACMGRAG